LRYESIACPFFNEQFDQSQSLWLVCSFGKELFITIKIEFCVAHFFAFGERYKPP
jgi:hypothetical protein